MTLHEIKKEQQDYYSSDNRIHIHSEYPVIAQATLSFLIQSSGNIYKSHPNFERQAYTRETVHLIFIVSLYCYALWLYANPTVPVCAALLGQTDGAVHTHK